MGNDSFGVKSNAALGSFGVLIGDNIDLQKARILRSIVRNLNIISNRSVQEVTDFEFPNAESDFLKSTNLSQDFQIL